MVEKQHGINQSATETPEKVQSKQTGLSHDSCGITGPHRSLASRRDQTTKAFSEYSAVYMM